MNTTVKNIAIIGASASGLYAAIFFKRKHPEYRVTVFDKNDKIGKKILATGNGHCNLMNRSFNPEAFNHPEFIETALNRYPVSSLFDELDSLGIRLTEVGDLVYPLSYSASSHVRFLAELLTKHGIELSLSTKITGYRADSKVHLSTDKGEFAFDEILFAVGGELLLAVHGEGEFIVARFGAHFIIEGEGLPRLHRERN